MGFRVSQGWGLGFRRVWGFGFRVSWGLGLGFRLA